MPIDVDEPDSPGWWLQRCAKKLDARRPRLQKLADIVEGDAPFLDDLPVDLAESYRRFRREARTNYADLIVQTLARRIVNDGFRTPLTEGSGSDPAAQQLWDANGMSVELPDIVSRMVGMGDSYAMLGRVGGEVTITGEDAREVVTIHDPVRQRVVRAGAKIFHDDDQDLDLAYLQLPGKLHVAYRERKARARGPVRFSPSSWEWDERRGGEDGQDTGASRVLIVRYRMRRGVAVFEPHIDLLTRLDRQVFRRDVIAAVQAFRQRAVFDTPDEDDEGNEINWGEILLADPGAMWRLPGDDSKIWESTPIDIRPLDGSIDADVKKLSAVTSTPMSVFFPDAAAGSAAGAALMRDEHVANARDLLNRVDESTKDLMSIAFELDGDTARSNRTAIEALWAPVERRSLNEMADAESKSQAIPFRTRMTKIWGFSEEEVDRMELQREEEALAAAAAQFDDA